MAIGNISGDVNGTANFENNLAIAFKFLNLPPEVFPANSTHMSGQGYFHSLAMCFSLCFALGWLW